MLLQAVDFRLLQYQGFSEFDAPTRTFPANDPPNDALKRKPQALRNGQKFDPFANGCPIMSPFILGKIHQYTDPADIVNNGHEPSPIGHAQNAEIRLYVNPGRIALFIVHSLAIRLVIVWKSKK
ncbi:hypothetical protein SAMN06295888_11155 [Desulfonatronum zhilinae]|nr:hypothetical protein SAMN06295888_11155 [Desulfonatronum zhilinae]